MTTIGAYRSRFEKRLVDAFNEHLNKELVASYHYFDLATRCGRQQVALPGFRAFFEKESLEERGHAQQVIDYLTLRGQDVTFSTLEMPTRYTNDKGELTAEQMLNMSLDLEYQVTDSLYKLVDLASECNDHHAEDWICEFLEHQLESNYELESMATKLYRVGKEGHGLYDFDRSLQSSD